MAILELILNYIDVLVWPTVLVWLVLRFSDNIHAVVTRILKGNEFEFRFGSNQLRVKIVDELAKDIVKSLPSAPEYAGFDKKALAELDDKIRIISAINNLSDSDLKTLYEIGTELCLRSDLPQHYTKLCDLGLVDTSSLTSDGAVIRITKLGTEVLSKAFPGALDKIRTEREDKIRKAREDDI